jgi:methylmalonyl-CoA/ethylmalonyl-CoA epimerase
MIIRLEHIGIAVENMKESAQLFDKLLGREIYKIESVASEQVQTAFYRTGESKIELVASESEENAISKYLTKKGPGIHHIAFEVDDIYETMEEMKAKGFQLLSDSPKKGADNKLVVFLHPKTTNGVLVEFCQEIEVPL